jgi:predicted DNA-binding antitoxin AbrB/MazE fold protein
MSGGSSDNAIGRTPPNRIKASRSFPSANGRDTLRMEKCARIRLRCRNGSVPPPGKTGNYRSARDAADGFLYNGDNGGPVMTIHAVYENGVFRPIQPVALPEGTVVQLQTAEESIDVRALVPPGTDEDLIRGYEILGRRFTSGHHDTAERHNEHQP